MAPTVVGGEGEATRQTVFSIGNMCCPTEEALIRNNLSGTSGIVVLEFNLIQRKLIVSHQLGDSAPILAALRACRGCSTLGRFRKWKIKHAKPVAAVVAA